MEDNVSFDSDAALDSHHINKKAKSRTLDLGVCALGAGAICLEECQICQCTIHIFVQISCMYCSIRVCLQPTNTSCKQRGINIWHHSGLLDENGYGYYSGKIREHIFKKEGRLIVQGSLGGWVIPQPTTHVGLRPIPQPVPLQMGPTTQSIVFK
jgi:hypothetical protein